MSSRLSGLRSNSYGQNASIAKSNRRLLFHTMQVNNFVYWQILWLNGCEWLREYETTVSECLFLTDDFTEELLNQHEAEVKTLEKYYEDHKELFEGVTKWQENWLLYLELDVSSDFRNLEEIHWRQTAGFHTRVDLCIFLSRKRLMTLQGSTTEAEISWRKRNRELTCRKVCPRWGLV